MQDISLFRLCMALYRYISRVSDKTSVFCSCRVLQYLINNVNCVVSCGGGNISVFG